MSGSSLSPEPPELPEYKPLTLLSFIFLLFREDFLHGHELSHDILCTSRSDDNRRAAGAVDSTAFGIHYNQTNLHLIDGPAARHFGLFSVFCGLFISVHSRPFVVPYQSFWLRFGRSMLSVVSNFQSFRGYPIRTQP